MATIINTTPARPSAVPLDEVHRDPRAPAGHHEPDADAVQPGPRGKVRVALQRPENVHRCGRSPPRGWRGSCGGREGAELRASGTGEGPVHGGWAAGKHGVLPCPPRLFSLTMGLPITGTSGGGVSFERWLGPTQINLENGHFRAPALWVWGVCYYSTVPPNPKPDPPPPGLWWWSKVPPSGCGDLW